MKFLDLVACTWFSNQQSARFDRLYAQDGFDVARSLASLFPCYLFSEFNLFYGTERRLALADDPDSYLSWFASRIDLFHRICLPSFDSLFVKPSAWFLLCDQPQSEQEQALLHRLQGLSTSFSIITDDFRSASSDHERHYQRKPALIRRAVESVLGARVPSAIVTTRLDTDDCIGSAYFYNLQKYLFLREKRCYNLPPSDFIANMPIGAQIELSSTAGLDGESHHGSSSSYRINSAKALIFGENCFTSRVEYVKPAQSLSTVWSCPHDEVFGVLPVENLVTQSPAWYQVVHGRNVANHLIDSDMLVTRESLPAYLCSS